MSLVGRALARLVARAGGQLLFEAPDDLPPSYTMKFVNGANAERQCEPAFCLFVHDRRVDVADIKPAVDFRELAMYRQGNHLAVTYASDNRGMATYTSVYPMLFSPGFPSSSGVSASVGVADLRQLISALVQVLAEVHALNDEQVTTLLISCQSIAEFLAEVYAEGGNGQSTLVTDWWIHLDGWMETLSLAFKSGLVGDITRTAYGSAGLPHPRGSAFSLEITPRQYLQVLGDRWSEPQAIRRELARLQGISTATEAAESLLRLDWSAAYTSLASRTDSLASRIPLSGLRVPIDSEASARLNGWSALGEQDFENYADLKGKLRLEYREAELPAWGASPRVLIAPPEAVRAHGVVYLDDVTVVVPWKLGKSPTQSVLEPHQLALLRVCGDRGTTATFAADGARVERQGLIVHGTLEISPTSTMPNAATIAVYAQGGLSEHLVDRADTSFLIVRPNEMGVVVRPHGRASRKAVRGPALWSSGDPSRAIDLDKYGTYEVGVIAGRELIEAGNEVTIGDVRSMDSWPGACRDELRLFRVEILDTVSVVVGNQEAFRFTSSAVAQDAPLSPLIAAANGSQPAVSQWLDPHNARNPLILGQLELELTKCLDRSDDSSVLGALLLSTSTSSTSLDTDERGVICDSAIVRHTAMLTPGTPTSALTTRASYRELARAYTALGIPEYLAEVETNSKTDGLTISRVSLEFLPQERVAGLLNAYTRLVADLDGLTASDAFWAKHPFSAVVYPVDQGSQEPQAILLSPLHPIRLGWMWAVQAGLRALHEDDGKESAVRALGLLDGTQFPCLASTTDGFAQAIHFVPVPVDAEPDSLYLGWQTFVRAESSRLSIPSHLQAHRFPVQGLSGLSPASVTCAVDDFMRVSPEVQSLRIELEATNRVPRSTAIDQGILAKIESLSEGSADLDGVAGIHIADSTNRLGPVPSLGRVRERMANGRHGFNAQWKTVGAGSHANAHITFLEGLAAKAAVVQADTPSSGWISTVPLRRFARRSRGNGSTGLDFSLASPPVGELGLWAALRSYESDLGGRAYQLMVRPDLVALPGRPNWLVSGDFGVDPQAVSHATRTQAEGRYMLWDWRPVSATGNRALSGRAQPYFVVASIPEALSAAISDRILKLQPGLAHSASVARTKHLMGVLAGRAVGLNTLLAVGHHQATGALGFFFALSSLERWLQSAPHGELRFVVPVDAVDPYLTVLANDTSGSRKRADLLAVRVVICEEERPTVVLMPLEIKHYGLSSPEKADIFPRSGEARLEEHLEQLRHYQAKLDALCTSYSQATGGQVSILGQQIGAVAEAAMQLSPVDSGALGVALLRSLADGAAVIKLGKGVLLWYQAGATCEGGEKARVDVFDGSPETSHIEVRVDPAAFDAAYWENAEGLPHQVVAEALRVAGMVQCETVEPPPSDQTDLPSAVVGAGQEEPAAPAGDFPLTNPAPVEQSESGPDPESGRSGSAPSAEQKSVHGSGEVSQAAEHRTSRYRLSDEKLLATYKQILAAFDEFRVKVQVPSGMERPYQEGPAFVQYAVDPAYGVAVNKIEGQLENLKLRLRLEADAVIGSSTHRGHVLLTIPKPDHERYFISTAELWDMWVRPTKGFRIPLGEDIKGGVVDVELSSSNSPHLLIAGVTGSGKSEALLTLLQGAAHFYSPSELRFRLIDPKQVELVSLEDDPHTDGAIGFTPLDAIAALSEATLEMDRRYEAFRLARVRDISEYQAGLIGEMPRWLIVLDEYADLTTEDAERKEIEKLLRRLSQKARAAGIHLVVSTQKPIVQVLNSVVKGNLPGRIALRVNTGVESRVILDDGGAEQLVGKGDALLKVGSQPIRLQFARHHQ